MLTHHGLLLLLSLSAANANVSFGRLMSGFRTKRAENVIDDCMLVISEPGYYAYKSIRADSTVCGVYIMAEPDRLVEVYFDHFDVPCSDGGLVAFVDGWELNGGYFPRVEDGLPLNERVTEFCGDIPRKKLYISSQNAALIQYRVPMLGRGFSIYVRFIRNPKPCNVLVEGTAEMYMLRNYGKAMNCSLTALFPVRVRILSMDVGMPSISPHFKLETGIFRKCSQRGFRDYLQIGGGADLGLSKFALFDNICGVDSVSHDFDEALFCGVSTVRLVSSGRLNNMVTLSMIPSTEEDLTPTTFICPP